MFGDEVRSLDYQLVVRLGSGDAYWIASATVMGLQVMG